MNRQVAHKTDQVLSLNEKLSWLQLARTENVGPITFFNFIDYYGSADKALEAIPELAKRGGRKKPLSIPPINVIEKEYERLQKIGGDIIAVCEPDYPLALAANEDAPPIISVIGNPDLMKKPCLAIVGSRNASLNGRKFAEQLAHDLGQQGQVIISGLARGIDTSAHIGALDTGTIAVVAGGIDVVYPTENQDLYDRIKEQGLIVAESSLGQKPFAQSFPRRNRIVSGLSSGTIIVEANMRSGSLITARLAGEQGRDVYAVPGHPMDPRAQGTNKLIRDGATLIRNAADVIEDNQSFTTGNLFEDSAISRFDPAPTISHEPDSHSFDEARRIVLDNMSYNAVDINELIRATEIETALIQTVLLELELAGRIQRLPGNRVTLIEN